MGFLLFNLDSNLGSKLCKISYGNVTEVWQLPSFPGFCMGGSEGKDQISICVMKTVFTRNVD